MSAPAYEAQPPAVRNAAVKDYAHYLDECDTFDISGQTFSVWWERYHESYTVLCGTCGYWKATTGDQCEACATQDGAA